MDNEKYIVFNREEFDRHFQGTRVHYGVNPIEDAVVIRLQDVFAAPALAAYANLITAAIHLSSEINGHVPGVDDTPEAVKDLQRIADYFHSKSEASYLHGYKKIPD